jgi:deoxyribonuclease-4
MIARTINLLSNSINTPVCPLLLEVCSGQGTALMKTVEDYEVIKDMVDGPEKIGLCIDTCHVFASGTYDLSTTEEVIRMMDHPTVQSDLKLLHLNDSHSR